jgi:hypothetical protein
LFYPHPFGSCRETIYFSELWKLLLVVSIAFLSYTDFLVYLKKLAHYQSHAEKIKSLRRKINEAQQTVQLKRKEAKDNVERHAKAEWFISLCSHRVICSYCLIKLSVF